MCGVFGIYGYKNVASEMVDALGALQHRGQDSAGIATFDQTFHVHKGLGLAQQAFLNQNIDTLQGPLGIAHVRYSTQGSTDIRNAQPLTRNFPYGLAMVHNGNVTNFKQLQSDLSQQHFHLIDTKNDVELLLALLSVELGKKQLHALSVDDIFSSVECMQRKVEGAYACLSMIAGHGLLAFMDPHGIRPLTLGQKNTADGPVYALASESVCFDYLGYKILHNMQPGEALFIDQKHQIHSKICHSKASASCVFEYVYFAKEDSQMHGRLVAHERERMGERLAKYFKEHSLNPDVIIDVPSSSYFYAQGLSKALNVPYKRGLVKNNHAKRSFISPCQEQREQLVRRKLNPLRSTIEGKKVAVVDDSIVRGTTSKHIIHLLREAGAKDIYFVSGSPPVQHPCIYGIDMTSKGEMIASQMPLSEIGEYLGADALIYPEIEDLHAVTKGLGVCSACFTGRYPSCITEETLRNICQDKVHSCR